MRIKITKNYQERELFKDFELEIEEGGILCILGESGVGKTTLLNALAGLIEFDGEVQGVPDQVAYVFQTPRLLPHLTVKENLLYALGNSVQEEKIAEMLEKCHLTECENRKVKTLSGGEKKRVALARAFLSKSKLLLMDEPFVSVDTALKLRLIELFAKLWQENKKTVVFVTHDIEEALMVADKIILLTANAKQKEFLVKRETFPSGYGEENSLRAEILSEILGNQKE